MSWNRLLIKTKNMCLIIAPGSNGFFLIKMFNVSCRSQWPSGLRRRYAVACWDCGFESRWGLGGLSLVNVVCCSVKVTATGPSLDRRSPTECGVSECDLETSTMRSYRPTSVVDP